MIQTITSFIGAAGFALVFNVRGKKLIWIGLGGALSWIVYKLGLELSGSPFAGLLVATIAVVAAGEILARRIRVPVIMLMVPMLIPLVPGGDLYYTMRYLIGDDNELFLESLRSLLMQAGAIAVGVIVATSVMTNFFAFYYKRKRKLEQLHMHITMDT
ncbi:MAG: threonine/serine exporter [Ruminococcaceae bacterium]|nr:threonine/serine exporter [Oscillospiraceae bacterium]